MEGNSLFSVCDVIKVTRLSFWAMYGEHVIFQVMKLIFSILILFTSSNMTLIIYNDKQAPMYPACFAAVPILFCQRWSAHNIYRTMAMSLKIRKGNSWCARIFFQYTCISSTFSGKIIKINLDVSYHMINILAECSTYMQIYVP